MDPEHRDDEDRVDLSDAASPDEAASTEDVFSADSPAPTSGEPLDLTDEVAALIDSLTRERDDALGARQRALADFANFQRRARENEVRARQQGVTSVVRSLLPVMDHFDLALAQDPSKVSVEQLLGGVKIVRAEFVKLIESLGVTRIDPVPGDPLDPMRHEAMMRQPAPPGVEPGRVAAVFQPGYAMGDLIIRPAKVTIAAEPDL
jgi:molecular chaperone GrpE